MYSAMRLIAIAMSLVGQWFRIIRNFSEVDVSQLMLIAGALKCKLVHIGSVLREEGTNPQWWVYQCSGILRAMHSNHPAEFWKALILEWYL